MKWSRIFLHRPRALVLPGFQGFSDAGARMCLNLIHTYAGSWSEPTGIANDNKFLEVVR